MTDHHQQGQTIAARRLLLATAMLFSLGLIEAPAASAEQTGAPAYDRLDLSSADAALRTFLSAYCDGDYLTAYWIFASGRWRLLQIVPPGGDEKALPIGLSDH